MRLWMLWPWVAFHQWRCGPVQIECTVAWCGWSTHATTLRGTARMLRAHDEDGHNAREHHNV